MITPVDIEEPEYESDAAYWSVCGFRVATLEFSVEEPGEGWNRCGTIRFLRPVFSGDHRDLKAFQWVLADMEKVLKAWVEDGIKPDFSSRL